MLKLYVALSVGVTVLAQRPQNASICDYYAGLLYGTNTSQTQYQLTQKIITLAFAGAPPGSTNISSDLTGILNPGIFAYQGTKLGVNLLPWFNGSIDSTNLNNQAASLNWLDGGGLDPLYAFINGSTDMPMMQSSTNQYRLFTHIYEASTGVFDCSDPAIPSPIPNSAPPPPNLAYVHKFMNLNQTDIGHFIAQTTLAAQHYGFSHNDASTINTQLNSVYNVACGPPITQGGQQVLSSLCMADTCPLALDPDCAAYVNLSGSGVANAASSSLSAIPTHFIPTLVSLSPTNPTTSSSSNSNSNSTLSSSSSTTNTTLSPGAIAGIAIASAAVLLAFLLALIYILRKRKTIHMLGPPPPTSTSAYGTTSSGLASPPGEQKYPKSFTSSPMGSPGFIGHFPDGQAQGQLGMQQMEGLEVGREPVEMDARGEKDGRGSGPGMT